MFVQIVALTELIQNRQKVVELNINRNLLHFCECPLQLYNVNGHVNYFALFWVYSYQTLVLFYTLNWYFH